MNSPPSEHSSPPTPYEYNNNQGTSVTPTFATQESPQLSISNASQPSPITAQPASGPQLPVIIITEADPEVIDQQTDRAAPIPRQSRSLASRHKTQQSSSQPPRPSPTSDTVRSRSEPRTTSSVAMSSAGSSPSTTTTSGTSGTTSGSNPGYHLPYAPFPYPMPGNARGGQSNQGSSGGSSGK